MADKLPPLFPHLVVSGASDAIELYKKAFGATEVIRMPAEDGKRLLHAHIVVNGANVYLTDTFPEYREQCGNGAVRPPTELGGTSCLIHLEGENCDASVQRAVDAGAKVMMAPWNAFWGARYGQVVDPFGHGWSFAHPLPAK